MRERGLKFLAGVPYALAFGVAPRAGAWIEIMSETESTTLSSVAPRAGAWIEISLLEGSVKVRVGRSPCGSVD